MPKHETQTQAFIAEEVRKVKGIAVPARAGALERALVRKVKCSKLHPNPNDEFCFPEVGPNEGIVSEYSKAYRMLREDPDAAKFLDSSIKEPLTVQKIRPDGYMILNGHHRWWAACQAGIEKLPVKIVDLTQEKDVRRMLSEAGFERRVTMDLDEVVFRPESDPCLEKPLRFPLRKIYKERLRLGIPALFNMMNRDGYDIWVCTARYVSLDYLRYYFRHYGVHVTGIVTGTARKAPHGTDTRKALETLLNSRYRTTVYIDNESLLRTSVGSQAYEEYRLNGSGTWSRDVMDAFDEMKKHEQT